MAKMLMLNPAPRKRRRKARRKNPIRARAKTRNIIAMPKKTRRRRNPIGGMKANGLVTQTVNAFIGAGGAIGVSSIAKMLPLPTTMRTGYMRDLTHAGLAIGLGLIVEKGLKQRATARKITEGALTVIAHNAMLRAVGPNLGLPNAVDGYDDWSTSIYPGLTTAMYPNIGTGMGAYQNAGPIQGANLSAYN